MSIKFNTSEYAAAAERSIRRFLAGVDAASILRAPEAEIVEWPPRPKSKQDRHAYEAGLVMFAYQLARLRLPTARARAVSFLRIVTIAYRAAEEGARSARVEVGGYNEAEGKRAFKKAHRMATIKRALMEGVSKEEAFLRAGVSRAQGYRYLAELRCPKAK